MPVDNSTGFFVWETKMKIYTDASYDDKKGVAGMGIVICKGQKRRMISNWGRFKSINEAELFAIYQGCILSGGESCEIITDSQTALQYIEKALKTSRGLKNSISGINIASSGHIRYAGLKIALSQRKKHA